MNCHGVCKFIQLLCMLRAKRRFLVETWLSTYIHTIVFRNKRFIILSTRMFMGSFTRRIFITSWDDKWCATKVMTASNITAFLLSAACISRELRVLSFNFNTPLICGREPSQPAEKHGRRHYYLLEYFVSNVLVAIEIRQ